MSRRSVAPALAAVLAAAMLCSSGPARAAAASLYTLDGAGGVHPVGGAPALAQSAYWPGWNFARGLALFSGSGGGYVADAFGGVHPVGNAPYVEAGARWPGWDIVRGIALIPGSTASSPAGYVLDGWGGLHPFGGAPQVSGAAYWPNWDIARAVVMAPWASVSQPSGWVLDGWGGINPFGGAPALTPSAYWPGWDIARGLAINPDSTTRATTGYVLDGWGGINPVGGAPAERPSDYWPYWDIARSLVLDSSSTATNPAGFVMDGYGGYHQFGGAPQVSGEPYWPGWEIAVGSAAAGGSSSAGRVPVPPSYPAPWRGHRPEFFGLVGSGINGAGPTDQQIISVTQASGARSVRVEFQWSQLEQTRGNYQWPTADQAMQQFDGAGVDVLGLLDYNNPIYGGGEYDSPDPGAWRTYVSAVVGRYHSRVRAWEIWNEENTAQFMTSGVNPCQYAALLNLSRDTIRGIDPGATVVSGGVGGVDVPYLSAMMNCGAQPDVIAVHPYTSTPPDANVLDYLHRVQGRVWFTEFGYQGSVVGDGTQAAWLIQTFADWAAIPNVERAYWYNYGDVSWSPQTFGLLRADGSDRPALAAYASLPKG
ncbi:MAG: glycoside hydrolase 5 family protein [Candidatus Dormibacteria bacterium]